MPDFEEMIAALRADCATRPLAAPAQLRQAGDRRIHRRRVVLSGTAATAVTGIAVAAVLVVPGGGNGTGGPVTSGSGTSAPVSSAAGTDTSGPVAPSSSAPGSSTSGPSAPSSSAPGSSASEHTGGGLASGQNSSGGTTAACRADQIGRTPATQIGGAAGHLGLTVTVTNKSGSSCRLDGFPVLWHTESGHAPAVVPTVPSGSGEAVVLKPGGQAMAQFVWVDNYGGYSSTSPQCANPQHYHALALAIGGSDFSLAGITMDVLCDDVSANPWQ